MNLVLARINSERYPMLTQILSIRMAKRIVDRPKRPKPLSEEEIALFGKLKFPKEFQDTEGKTLMIYKYGDMFKALIERNFIARVNCERVTNDGKVIVIRAAVHLSRGQVFVGIQGRPGVLVEAYINDGTDAGYNAYMSCTNEELI